jgi:hypothetical protein
VENNSIVLSDDFIYCIGEIDDAKKFFVRDQKYLHLAKKILGTDDVFVNEKGPYTNYTPIYELHLIRKKEIVARKPSSFVKLGKFFHIGPIKNDGEVRYPVFASRLCEGIHLQIHKNVKNIITFNSNGNVISTPSPELSRCLIDIWRMHDANQAVFNAILAGETLYIFDILLLDDDPQFYLRRFKQRYNELLSIGFVGNVTVLPHFVIQSPQNLVDINDGKYIIKWENEKLNIRSPYWYVISVKNQQYIEEVQTEEVQTKEVEIEKECDVKLSTSVYDILFNLEQCVDYFYATIKDNKMIIDINKNNSIILHVNKSDLKDREYKIIFGCLIQDKEYFRQEFFILSDANKFIIYSYDSNCNIERWSDKSVQIPLILTDEIFNIVDMVKKINVEHVDALVEAGYERNLPINYEERMLEFTDLVDTIN